MRNTTRMVLSAAAVVAYPFVDRVVTNASSLAGGEMAVRQFDNADQPVQQTLMQTLSGMHVSPLALGVALGAIWYAPLRRAARKAISDRNIPMALFLAAGIGATLPTTAHAYYETKDNPEYVEILPNQTAFAIPEQGANKTSQAAFMSEQYLAENKVALKRFQVPHVLIHNSFWDADRYVPSVKLLIVDRAPYMREWVDDSDRGTSAKKEGFRVESGDSINIDFGVVISASVSEENAAKFVYSFGAKNIDATKSNDPNVTFASVIEGRSLANVMDSNVRGKVQAILSREFGKRSTEDCIAQKADIMSIVEKEVKDAFAPEGITINYVGLDTALNFESDEIQQAINETFIAKKKAQAALTMLPAIPALQAQATVSAMQAFSKAVEKWNGQLPNMPSFMVVSPELTQWLSGAFTRNDSAFRPQAGKGVLAPMPQ